MATLLTRTHRYFAYHISGKVLQGTRATSESNGKILGEKVNATKYGNISLMSGSLGGQNDMSWIRTEYHANTHITFMYVQEQYTQ
jgi:hypothetical protein